MERVANSTPMVDLESRLNSFRVNRESRLDFPTPESPMRTTMWGGALVLELGGKIRLISLGIKIAREGTFKKKLDRAVISRCGLQYKGKYLHRIRRWPWLRYSRIGAKTKGIRESLASTQRDRLLWSRSGIL